MTNIVEYFFNFFYFEKIPNLLSFLYLSRLKKKKNQIKYLLIFMK